MGIRRSVPIQICDRHCVQYGLIKAAYWVTYKNGLQQERVMHATCWFIGGVAGSASDMLQLNPATVRPQVLNDCP